eukprot:399042_1
MSARTHLDLVWYPNTDHVLGTDVSADNGVDIYNIGLFNGVHYKTIIIFYVFSLSLYKVYIRMLLIGVHYKQLNPLEVSLWFQCVFVLESPLLNPSTPALH